MADRQDSWSSAARAMILVLVGPTAVGKSGLAIELAELMVARGRPAEIINADAMLVYRGLDIGTAKPTAEQQRRVRHHLIDQLDLSATASVADFQHQARTVIAGLQAAGTTPVVAGGSALYTRALLDQFSFPGTDPARRAALERELESRGPAALHARLAGQDPDAAAAIGPGNGRRIVRALEVIALTGQPYSASLPVHRYALPGVVQIGLDAPREWVDQRIAQRVEQMWADGLVEEVAALAERGLRVAPTASKAIGYRQVLAMLSGELDRAEAIRQTVVATRRFSRRQGGWFRRDDRVHWVDARHVTPAAVLALADRVHATGSGPDRSRPAGPVGWDGPAARDGTD